MAMHGLFLMDFKPCTDIAIMGVGTIGNLVLQAAKIMGPDISMPLTDDERLALAKSQEHIAAIIPPTHPSWMPSYGYWRIRGGKCGGSRGKERSPSTTVLK